MSKFVRGPTGELSLSLRESILTREREARRLDLSRDDLDELWAAVGERILLTAAERGAALAYAAGEPDEPAFLIDEASGAAADALATLDRVAHFGINQTSGGHFAFIPGGGLFPAALGDLMADVANPYAGVRFAAPAATAMERSLVHWMAELVGYPQTAGVT